MKTKRILALLLAAMVMVFGLVACNKENKPSDTENKTQTTDENKKMTLIKQKSLLVMIIQQITQVGIRNNLLEHQIRINS